MDHLSKSVKDTEKLAVDFLRALGRVKNGNESGAKHATVVALSGDLGSGKTAFVQAVAKVFDIKGVTSPTFIIEKIYELTANPPFIHNFKHLIHIDAYRLENGGKELQHLGWNDIAGDPANLIFIEWPEKVADIIPETAIRLSFKFVDKNSRRILIQYSKHKT